jgi:small nuclear ribonucleoprotein (snRNP)-like protein
MSIYTPPNKQQSIFNPRNFGSLGQGGEINREYLNANFLAFPVAQGTITLVSANVLGDINQQGDYITSGDIVVDDISGDIISANTILIGTQNLLTEITTNTGKIITINGSLETIASDVSKKQERLITGENISIDTSNNITLTEVVTDSELSTALDTKQNKLITGSNISIDASNNITLTEVVTGSDLTTALDTKQNKLITGDNISIDASNNITLTEVVTDTDLSNALETKQNKLITGDNISIDASNNITLTEVVTDTDLSNALELKQNKLITGDNISIDASNNITLTEVVTDTDLSNALELKQNKLITGDNISIDASNNITLTEVVTDTDLSNALELKQNKLITGDNISIDASNNITLTEVVTDTDLSNALNAKQDTLKTTTNIDTGLINAGTITIRSNSQLNTPIVSATTSMSAPTITAGTNLFYGANNVGTKITGLEDNKQNKLTAGNNITIDELTNVISSTGGTAIDSSTDLICRTLTTINNATIGGRLTIANRISFRVGRETASNFSGNVTMPLNFEDYDYSNSYNTGTYTFTAPIKGMYVFYINISSNGNNSFGLNIRVNSPITSRTILRLIQNQNGAGSNKTTCGTTITLLEANDQVSVVKTNGIIRFESYPDSFFGGHFLA